VCVCACVCTACVHMVGLEMHPNGSILCGEENGSNPIAG